MYHVCYQKIWSFLSKMARMVSFKSYRLTKKKEMNRVPSKVETWPNLLTTQRPQQRIGMYNHLVIWPQLLRVWKVIFSQIVVRNSPHPALGSNRFLSRASKPVLNPTRTMHFRSSSIFYLQHFLKLLLKCLTKENSLHVYSSNCQYVNEGYCYRQKKRRRLKSTKEENA